MELQMDWEKLLTVRRFGRERELATAANFRTQHDADVDRILFSGAFRRLARKTQVHPLAVNDHVHTRLTHSLEVAQVGQALGCGVADFLARKKLVPAQVAAGIPSIMRAACLAHDLGNPPLGHAGEEAMKHWLAGHLDDLVRNTISSADWQQDLVRVEGNAQGFRMLTQTENHLFDGGLQLTYATLGAFLKYPHTSSASSSKFSVYMSEGDILDKVASALGLHKIGDGWCRHPLAHLVECADDICYSVVDLDDAVELGIVKFDSVVSLFRPLFDDTEWQALASEMLPARSFRVNLARLRGRVFDKLVAGALEAFEKGYDQIMAGSVQKDIISTFLGPEDPRSKAIASAKQYATKHIFADGRKLEIELGAFAVFESLLDAFCGAAVKQSQHLINREMNPKTPWKTQLVMRYLGDHAPTAKNAPAGKAWDAYQCTRRALDYVCGMTDNYATYVAMQLRGQGFAGGPRP
jgi:dGTPase